MLDDPNLSAQPGVSGPQPPPIQPQVQPQAPAAVPLPKAESAAHAVSVEVLHPSTGETPPESAPVQSIHEVAKQQDIADAGKAARSLGKVARTVLRLLSALSSTAQAYLDSRIAEHESRARYIKSEIDKTIADTVKLRATPEYQALADHQANPNNASTRLKIPNAMLDKAVHLKKKVGSKKKVAQRAVEAGVHRNIVDKEIRGVGTMKAYRFEGQQSISRVEKEVTPTSFKLGKKGAKDSLTNVYVIMVDGKEYGVIRTGVINSKQRANEFLHLLKEMRAEIAAKTNNPNFKMRVLSHQLNSYENEGNKLIKPQHQWIAHVNKQMRDEGLGEVAHIDTSSNAFYTYAAKHPSTLGKILSGERNTKEMNVDGWGTYMGWMAEDLDTTTIATKAFDKDAVETPTLRNENILKQVNKDPMLKVELLKNNDAVDLLFSNNKDLAKQMTALSKNTDRAVCANKIADQLAVIAEKTEALKELNIKKGEQRQELKRLQSLLAEKEKQLSSMGERQQVIQRIIIDNLKADIAAREEVLFSQLTLEDNPTLKQIRDQKGTLDQLKSNLKDMKRGLTSLSPGEKKEQLKKIESASKEIEKLEATYRQSIKQAVSSKTILKQQATQLKREIAAAEKVVKKERENMKGVLIEEHSKLEALESHLESTIKAGKPKTTKDEAWAIQKQVLQDALEKTTLMRQILGSQLSIPGKVLDRGQEGMAIQLLNIKLGITSQLNCKSGIDRTGLWHAIRVSMDEIVAQTKGNTADLFAMVSDWNNITNFVNQQMKEKGEDHFLKWVDKPGSSPAEESLKIKYRNIIEFRKLVLKNLLTLGLDITQASTLFTGAKYHIGTMQENTTPLNFLPPSVTIGDETHQLVKHDSTGRPSGFDQSGADLIEGLSTERGS